MIYLINVSQVKVSFSIKVHVAAVVSEALADLLTILEDATVEVLLALFRNLTYLIVTIKVVSFIMELKFP